MKKSITIQPEIINHLAKEIMNELEENAKITGGKMTFDYIEEGVLRLRKKFGEEIMQRAIDMLGNGEMDQKKTAPDAMMNTGIKGLREKISSHFLGK
jgi:hypothetical protein